MLEDDGFELVMCRTCVRSSLLKVQSKWKSQFSSRLTNIRTHSHPRYRRLRLTLTALIHGKITGQNSRNSQFLKYSSSSSQPPLCLLRDAQRPVYPIVSYARSYRSGCGDVQIYRINFLLFEELVSLKCDFYLLYG